MPFGRPPIETHHLQHRFQRVRALNATQGNNNAGIWKVRDKETGRIYVEKKMNPQDTREGQSKNEMVLLRNLKHRNIIGYIHGFIEPDGPSPRASIIMEYCDKGSLTDFMKNYKRRGAIISENFVWSAFRGLVRAVGCLQVGNSDVLISSERSHGWAPILHRDLMPRNIFIRISESQSHPLVLIGDFGCAIRCPGLSISEFLPDGGPFPHPMWFCPESPAYGAASEVWHIGAIIQTMYQLDFPVDEDRWSTRFGFLGAGGHYSRELTRAIEYCMHDCHCKRPTVLMLGAFLADMKAKEQYYGSRYEIPEWAYGGPEWY